MSWPRSDHTKQSYVRRAAEVGDRVRSVCMFVSLPASSFSGSIDRRMSCLMWRWHASEAADAMCHPFVTSTLSNPSQKALPLCVCCYACGLPQHRGCVQCVHVCLLAHEVCVSLPWQIYWNSQPPCLHWRRRWRRGKGREHGPLWKTPVLPLNPAALNAAVPQPSWHLPWDVLNELKEIQWDTWCSSHGTPLLLRLSAQLCPPARAQRRTHHGTKNTQSATVYQADLSSSPTTTPPPPPPPPNTFPYIPSANVWLFPLRLYTFWHLSDCRDGGNCKPRKRAKGHLCSLGGNFSLVESLFRLIEREWSRMG